MRKTRLITEITNEIQESIDQLYLEKPDNETFEQEGFLNGSQIVQEYLEYNEYGLAIEHLLYMFYESDINRSDKIIEQLNKLTIKYKIENRYQ